MKAKILLKNFKSHLWCQTSSFLYDFDILQFTLISFWAEFFMQILKLESWHVLYNMTWDTVRSVTIRASTQSTPNTHRCKSLISWFTAHNKMIFLSSYKEDLHIQFVFPFKKCVEVSQKISSEASDSNTNSVHWSRQSYV